MKSQFLLILALLAVISFSADINAEQDLSGQRAQFELAYQTLTAGRVTRANELIQGLENYPLYMYFRHHQLASRLHGAPEPEIRQFLTAYDGSSLERLLRSAWLKLLGQRKQWGTFLEYYRPQQDVRLKCLNLTARIRSQATDGILEEAKMLWLSGKSQPDECDPALAELKSSPLMNDELIWQRIRLSLEQGNTGLTRYLGRGLSSEKDRALLGVWIAVHADPERALRHALLQKDTPLVREIVRYGIKRIARKNVDRALSEWRSAGSRYAFTAAERDRLQQELAIAAARTKHPDRISLLDRVAPSLVDETVQRYRLREAIALQDWGALARWTEQPPAKEVNDLRWRYWRARALQESGRDSEAQEIYRALAEMRDYYGFLAADRLGLAYKMNFAPIRGEDSAVEQVSRRPGIIRARELYLLDMRLPARREWQQEIATMTRPALEIAAQLAHAWGWYERAIATLGQAQSYDDLEIRFPVLHLDKIRAYAKKRNIEEAVLFSIIRTESAFMVDAQSPAGALGLMQLMPRTGRETAKQLGLKLGADRELLDADRNITIGSQYLKQMFDQFDGNFAMATAAYNAGPRQVASWRPDTSCVPAEVWIDAIPFTETRRYVQYALFYAAVYEWRLGQTPTPLRTRLSAVPGRDAKSQENC